MNLTPYKALLPYHTSMRLLQLHNWFKVTHPCIEKGRSLDQMAVLFGGLFPYDCLSGGILYLRDVVFCMMQADAATM